MTVGGYQSAQGNTTNRVDAVISQFRQYDQGVMSWVRDGAPLKQDGRTVHVVMATPDRAFSAMQHLLRGEMGDRVSDLKNIPLPFISISRTRVMFDPERFHGPSTFFNKIGTSPESPPLETYNTRFPLPYDITYQIEVWAKNRETLNAYELWVTLNFTNGFETFLPIDMREVWESWGTKQVPFENEGIQDSSDLEPQEGHRVLRFTQQLTAKAWLFGPVNTVKAVHQILIDNYLTEIDASLDVTGEEVDADPETYPKSCRIIITSGGTEVQNF